jgi:nucleoside-diphosphate-sugar epimerase
LRVLVTGATGFIGSHTARELLDAGHSVRLLVRNEEKARHLWADRPEALEDLVVGQITSGPDTARALRECDAVIHTAAPVALGVGRSAAKKVARANLRAIKLLIENALESGIERAVHLSSTTVLETRGRSTLDETAAVVTGGDSYARSKAAPENRVRELQESGAPIAITYPPAVVGPDDPGLSEGMKGLAAQLQSAVLITSSGFQLVDVRDLATIHRLLLEAPPKPRRYVVASRFMPWEEFAELVDRAAGIRIPRVNIPGRLMRGFGSMGDVLRNFVPIDPMLSREATHFATQWIEVDASRVSDDLDFSFRDPTETLADAVRWLASAGHIPPDRALRWTHKGRGRR